LLLVVKDVVLSVLCDYDYNNLYITDNFRSSVICSTSVITLDTYLVYQWMYFLSKNF